MDTTRILVVEDEAITAMEIQKRLLQLGYSVIAVTSSGEEAIRLAKNTRPDLILMDIFLNSETDGATAAKQIQEFHHVPVIFMTAYKDDDSFMRAKECGPLGYLTKPVETRDLRNMIELALFRHQAEKRIAELHARALLNDKLAIMGTLATSIIHEVNNPLNWVLNNLDEIHYKLKLMRHKNISPDKIGVIDDLNNIVGQTIEGAEKILDTIHDLKGFARIDAEDIKPVNIHEVLDNAIKMAWPQFKNHARVEKNYSPDISTILGSNKLHHVFLNLIINAAQAMEKTPQKNNVINFRTWCDIDWIFIEFKDTGAGISADILPDIFDPFFTTKPQGKGTGLGLSVCQEIIHGLGGKITVQSDAGKGTTFLVALQNQTVPKNPHAAENKVTAVTDGKKILVIDDEPILLNMLEKMLCVHQVTKTSNGEAVLNASADYISQFDTIITDLDMPGVNGCEIYHFLTRNHPGLARRMIFITGNAHTVAMTEFLASTDNPCLEKPFTRVQFLNLVNKVLNNEYDDTAIR